MRLVVLYRWHHRLRNFFTRSYLNYKSKPLDLQDRILIVAPHPDDEVFGCGSLIRHAVLAGKDVRVLLLSKGENVGIDEHLNAEEIKARRQKMTYKANALLGLEKDRITFLDFCDGGISFQNREEYNKMVAYVRDFAPQQVFVTSRWEVFPDHLIAHQMICELFAHTSTEIYEYCVWFWFFFKFRHVYKLFGKQVLVLPTDAVLKGRAVEAYFVERGPNTSPLSGDLPKEMIEASLAPKEYYIR